ncbi:MAG TPA: transposase [Spirochaetota bacterium]|nr:transposase [Spirochaetota bacterium]
MARPLRQIVQGVTYHCFTRCHGKRDLLKSRYARKYFIEAISMCQEKYNFELIAAETVSNHIHLVIKTLENKETISRIMQFIKARIAEKYNRATGESGPFWNERFGSSIIEEASNPEEYLLWLLWYIGYNPVRKGISRDPRESEIGFINCYLEENYCSPLKITLHDYFHRLGGSFRERAKNFLLYEDVYRKRLSVWV